MQIFTWVVIGLLALWVLTLQFKTSSACYDDRAIRRRMDKLQGDMQREGQERAAVSKRVKQTETKIGRIQSAARKARFSSGSSVDRAPGSEPVGREFESRPERQNQTNT